MQKVNPSPSFRRFHAAAAKQLLLEASGIPRQWSYNGAPLCPPPILAHSLARFRVFFFLSFPFGFVSRSFQQEEYDRKGRVMLMGG
jgi:hypothetical protein